MKDLYDFNLPMQTRQELVLDRLREAILRGVLKPGQRLDQNELADLLKVSRSPVREALRTLAAEGLVQVIPHRGAIVAELSVPEIEEIYTLRSLLEGMAVRLATPNLDTARLGELEAILEEIDQTSDPDAWLDLNDRFHHTIYEAAGRPRMLAIIDNLRNTVAPYIREFLASEDHARMAEASHRAIFEACLHHDPQRAEQEMQKHLMDVCAGALVRLQSRKSAKTEAPVAQNVAA